MRPASVCTRLALVSLVLAGAAVPRCGAAAEPYSFRGLALGTSLADLRRLRYPEAPTARILCSHDPEARNIRPTPEFLATTIEAAAGVSVCSAFSFGRVLGPTSSLPPEWVPARVRVGSIDVSPSFWFVPSAEEGAGIETAGRLYRITMRSNSALWEEALAAFVRRYGKPTRVEKGSMPAQRVGAIDNETAIWENELSSIRLVKRADRASRMTIVYQHSGLMPGAPIRELTPAPPTSPAPASDGGLPLPAQPQRP